VLLNEEQGQFIFALLYKDFALYCPLVARYVLGMLSDSKGVDSTFETLVNFYQNIRGHIPEDSNINICRCEILKSSEVALWLYNLKFQHR
jgi:hypothetical protein